jgi:acetyl esterase
MTLRTRFERLAIGSLLKLPAPVCGAAAAVAEPEERSELDARLRLLLAASGLRPQLDSLMPEQARRQYDELFALMDVPKERVGKWEDLGFAVNKGDIRVRVYWPEGATDALRPGVLFFHGGGHVIGSVDGYDHVCRLLCNRLGAVFASVEYRLAPEHKFPTAAEDAIAAWQWFRAQAPSFGADPTRLAVMGDSAGGNLAAVICQQAVARTLPLPSAQCLIYPEVDGRMIDASVTRYAQHLGLTRSLIHWFRDHYYRTMDDANNPLASPLLAARVDQLPPALVVTARDPLRDQGRAYADRLRTASVEVLELEYPHLIHGFLGMGGVVPEARRAILEICRTFGKML